MKQLLIFVFLSFFATSIYAQSPIDAQRPTMTESNTIVGKDFIQAENGSTFIHDSLEINTFVRFGLTDRLEFRVASSFNSPYVIVGGKVFISEAKKAMPGFSFALDYDLKAGIQNYIISATGAPTDRLFYTVNIGNDSDWWGIVFAGYSIGNGSVFAEYKYHENFEQINAGVTYIIKGEMQVDIHGGLIDYQTPYVGAGFSFRLRPR